MSVVRPDRRRRGQAYCTSAEQRGRSAAQPDAAAADSAAASAVTDLATAEEPNPPAAVLQQSTSPALASREDVLPSSSDVHAGLHHVNDYPQQPRVPGPPAVQSSESAAAANPPADASHDPHGDGSAAAVSTSSSLLAIPGHAVTGSGSDSSTAGPSSSVHSGGPAITQQRAVQQLGDTPAATAAAARDSDDSMAPKTLQQARAEMLRRQEVAKARHVSAVHLMARRRHRRMAGHASRITNHGQVTSDGRRDWMWQREPLAAGYMRAPATCDAGKRYCGCCRWCHQAATALQRTNSCCDVACSRRAAGGAAGAAAAAAGRGGCTARGVARGAAGS